MRKLISFFALLLISLPCNSQITNVTFLNGSMYNNPTYGKIELVVGLDQSVLNAIALFNRYDPGVVTLDAVLKDATTGNVEKKIPGFYMVKYPVGQLGEADGQQSGVGSWRLRFTLDEAKVYDLEITFKYYQQSAWHISSHTLKKMSAYASNNPGFLHFPKKNKYLEFTNGQPFFSIGANMAAYTMRRAKDFPPYNGTGLPESIYPVNTVSVYTGAVSAFASKGANFLKYTFQGGATDIEWDVLGNYSSYQYRAQDFDRILTECEMKDMYMQLCLWSWENFDEEGTAYWSWEYTGDVDNNPNNGIETNKHPYNIPGVQHKLDFFVNTTNCSIDTGNLDYMRRKIRYVLARWGYSPNVATLELVDEMDNLFKPYYLWAYCGTSSKCYNELLSEALIYLGEYIKEVNPRMMVTTGVASYNGDAREFYNSEVCDYSDAHSYNSVYLNGGSAIAQVTNKMLSDYKKPVLIGETGLGSGWAQDLSTSLDRQTQFSNPAWSCSFSGSFSVGLTYDIWGYLYNPGWAITTYHKFDALANFFKGEDMNKHHYTPIKNRVDHFAELVSGTHYLKSPDRLDAAAYTWFRYNTNEHQYDYDPADLDHVNKNGAIKILRPDPNTQRYIEDNRYLEAYALKSDKRIIGWVHNKTNYFYNLPFWGSHIPPLNVANWPFGVINIPDLSSNDEAISSVHYMAIENVNCGGPYKVEWYSTKPGASGIISSFTENNLYTVNGRLMVKLPDLHAVSSSIPDVAADYGFKISLNVRENEFSNGEWRDAEVNGAAETMRNRYICTTPDNRIFYKGDDGDMYMMYYDDFCWENKRIYVWGLNDQPHDASPIVAYGDKIMYRNNVGFLEQLYQSGTNEYTAYMHSNEPAIRLGSDIISKDGKIYYINTSGFMTIVYWNGSAYAHDELSWCPQVDGYHFGVTSTGKMFYRNTTGYLEQIYPSQNGYISYTHTNRAVEAGSEIKITPNDWVAFSNLNARMEVVYWDFQTLQFQSYQFNNLPKKHSSSRIAIAPDNSVYYYNEYGHIQEIVWANNQYTGTQLWMNDMDPTSDICILAQVQPSLYKMFYRNVNNEIVQLYRDNQGQWIHYNHQIPVHKVSDIVCDQFNKLLFRNDDKQMHVLFWNDPCVVTPPCTYSNYRKAKTKEEEGQVYTINNTAQIRVYPNPSSEILNIEFPAGQSTSIRVVSISGQIIDEMKDITNGRVVLNTSQYASGVYYCQITQIHGTTIKKVTVRH